MKKVFTMISLQGRGGLGTFRYEAVGNSKLQTEREHSFPILSAIEGYAEPGEKIKVVAVISGEETKSNLGAFKEQLAESAKCKGFEYDLAVVSIGLDQTVQTHTATFQSLIDLVEDDDDLYCCMTYGTKPQCTALIMAIQYAYRLKKNTSITCVVYGEVIRSVEPPKAYVYDMTALILLDEIVRMLAERGEEHPKEVIDSILGL